jgi:hypothetical protein
MSTRPSAPLFYCLDANNPVPPASAASVLEAYNPSSNQIDLSATLATGNSLSSLNNFTLPAYYSTMNPYYVDYSTMTAANPSSVNNAAAATATLAYYQALAAQHAAAAQFNPYFTYDLSHNNINYSNRSLPAAAAPTLTSADAAANLFQQIKLPQQIQNQPIHPHRRDNSGYNNHNKEFPSNHHPHHPHHPPLHHHHHQQQQQQQRQRAVNNSFHSLDQSYDERSVQNYKTEICRSHYSTGHCDYGDACQFAHGIQQLRTKDYDIKYKTELCKRYHVLGPNSCKFNNRCKFIHDEVRVKAGECEYWLVCPSENIIKVELVDQRNKQRLQQLEQLVFNPPAGPVSPLTPSPEPTPLIENAQSNREEEQLADFVKLKLNETSPAVIPPAVIPAAITVPDEQKNNPAADYRLADNMTVLASGDSASKSVILVQPDESKENI